MNKQEIINDLNAISTIFELIYASDNQELIHKIEVLASLTGLKHSIDEVLAEAIAKLEQ